MENKVQDLHNWEDLIQKAIKTDVKASFLPPLLFREIDNQVACVKRPTKNIKSSSQKASLKDLKAKNPKL